MRDGVAQPYSSALPVRILKLKKQTMRAANSRNPNLQGYLFLSERESHAALYQLRSRLLHWIGPPPRRHSPARGLLVYHRIGTVFICGAFFFSLFFSFPSERAERLLVCFIICAVALAARASPSSSSSSSRVFTAPPPLTRGRQARAGHGESRRGCQKNTLTRAPATNLILSRRTWKQTN